MDKKEIKEIINENIKLTGENIKLGYENMILEKKIERLEEKTRVIQGKKSAKMLCILKYIKNLRKGDKQNGRFTNF